MAGDGAGAEMPDRRRTSDCPGTSDRPETSGSVDSVSSARAGSSIAGWPAGTVGRSVPRRWPECPANVRICAKSPNEHAAAPVLLYRDIGPVAFDGKADVGRESGVSQRAVQHPDAETHVAVEPSLAEQRVRCGMSSHIARLSSAIRTSPPSNARATVTPRPSRRLPWWSSFAETASKLVFASMDVRPSSACTTRGLAVTRHPSRSCRVSCLRYPALRLASSWVAPVSRQCVLAHGPTLRLYPSPPVQRRPRRTPPDTLPFSNSRASPASPDAVTSFHCELR